MIRLWSRVGPFRALAILLLIGAVAGGVLVAADRPAKRQATASSSDVPYDTEREDAKQLAQIERERAEAERAARKDAQRKADEAAAAAAEQAKTVTSPSAKPGKSSKPPAPSRPNLPIPTSCNEYSGVKAIGCAELLNLGFGLDQMPCMDKLFQKESGWNYKAVNKSSGARGIPQALPPEKMASEGADWATNPATQIRWGIKYMKGRYKTPCGAWAHSQSTGWY